MEMSEYDLRKSEKIGQLYPVIVDAKGNIIDGFHRLEADPNWRRERIKEIDTEEKLLVARCVSNWHRRQVSREEKEEWLNGLAKIYKKQGLKVSEKDSSAQGRNEIIAKIHEVTGLNPTSVREYLRSEFKQEPTYIVEDKPRVPASHAILSKFGKDQKEYGEQLIKRHREEVIAEEKPKIVNEVKSELLNSPEFIREAIERAPELVPTLPQKIIECAKEVIEPKEMVVKEGIVYTVGEYECPNCKRHYWIRCNGKKDWVE
jgi:hypothetical protein